MYRHQDFLKCISTKNFKTFISTNTFKTFSLHKVFLKLFPPLQSGGFGAYSATDQEEILASSSGLLNFLFGKDRSGKLNRSAFTSSLAFRCKCTCRHFKEKNDVNDKSSHFQRRLRKAALRPDGRSHPA